MRVLDFFLARRIFAILGLSLTPLLTYAHPGHDGVPVHELSNAILALAAYYSVKRIVTFALAARRKTAA